MQELNHIYLTHPALSERDYRGDGFAWLDCHQEEKCIYSVLRESEREQLIAVFNFSDEVQTDYEVRTENANNAKLLLNSGWQRFHGNTPETEQVFQVGDGTITCTLQPFSAILIQLDKNEK